MLIRHPRSLILVALVTGLAACGTGPYEIEVDPAPRNCTGLAEGLCITAEVDEEPVTFFDGIEGFEFEWCQRARLVIHEEPVPMPPPDGSSIRYVLDEEVERVEVPGHEVTLTLFDTFSRDEESGEILELGFVPRCADGDPALCDELDAALADESVDRVDATFRCEEGQDVPLLVEVQEPDAE